MFLSYLVEPRNYSRQHLVIADVNGLNMVRWSTRKSTGVELREVGGVFWLKLGNMDL